MEALVTLLSLATKCPACGKPPNLRLFPLAQRKHASQSDDEPVATHRCRCGEVYVITAKAYRRAS